MGFKICVSQFLANTILVLIIVSETHANLEPHLGAVLVDCGGMINVTRGDTFYVAYKLNETIDNDENCLWTFVQEPSASNLLLQVELMWQGFNYTDQLSITTFNGYNSLATTSIRQKELFDFVGSGIFLTFQSGIGGGMGFMVKFTTELFIGHNRVTRAFDKIPGSTSYGPYTELDRVVIAINPPTLKLVPYVFSVDSITTEFSADCTNDGLEIYELPSQSHRDSADLFEYDDGSIWKLKSRVCTNGAVTTPFEIRTSFPIIALFWADLTESGGNFSLSWEPELK